MGVSLLMIIQNWRAVTPTIVHQAGIDYKLFLGQERADPDNRFACMEGMLYVAYAMLQPGRAYEAHSHTDHEEVYFIIEGQGSITLDGQTSEIHDGDAIYIGKGQVHSIANTDQDSFLRFLAFSSQC